MTEMAANSISYSLNDIALVVKRHTHDVRNALNGMELELTLLSDGATDPATCEAVRHLREAGAEIGRLMQGLSSKCGIEAPCSLPALQIAERWQADARHVASGASLEWNVQLSSETVCVETGLIRGLLNDALEMAAKISAGRPLQINCHGAEGRVVFEISVRKDKVGPAIADSHRAYWAVLRRLAERNDGRMQPATLSPEGSFPMHLSLPLHRAV